MRLACNNLTFQYPGSTTKVIDKLSFTIDEPGFHAVFGPSGVGKTSLARIISADVTDYQGHLSLSNIAKILYCYNTERLPGWTRVGRLLQQITPQGREALLEELINVFTLNNIMNSRFSQLSMGQQNRVNLIRYLVQDFDLLILDESLANVDEKLRHTILLYIKGLFPDKFFLSISHNLIEIAQFCKQIVVLTSHKEERQGRVIQGMNLQQHKETTFQTDKEELDTVILEIMNAC